MAKVKKKLTPAQKRAKKERKRKYEFIFINGKQVRIKRAPVVDGIPADQFMEENADPVWLHQNGLWELIPVEESVVDLKPSTESSAIEEDDEIPF